MPLSIAAGSGGAVAALGPATVATAEEAVVEAPRGRGSTASVIGMESLKGAVAAVLAAGCTQQWQ